MGIFDKAKDALNSDKGEELSDKGLDKAADAAKGKLGEDKADRSTRLVTQLTARSVTSK